MKPTLYIMCGAPGSGKSTWITQWIKDSNEDIRYVSRDEIRFSLLKDDEPYFSHEKEVYKKFVGTIAQTLIDGFDVVADATHLNAVSRHKLFYALHTKGIEFRTVCVCMVTSLGVCVRQNAMRSGRAHVPEDTLEAMYDSIEWPTEDEDRSISQIWFIRRE